MSTESPLASDPEPLSDPEPFSDDDGVLYDEEVTPQHGILGFTLRELLIVGVWLIAFVTSFFPVHAFPGSGSLWAQGVQWILALGVPTAAVFLIVLRRFSPDGIRRVGSLGIDQFASVAFSVSAVYWAASNWDLVIVTTSTGAFALTWLTILQFVAALAFVVLTVFAPLIPGLRDDFHGRLVTLAHRNANPVRPVIARPHVEKAEAAAPQPEPSVLDREFSGEHIADDVGTVDFGDRMPLTSHASGGDTGTETGLADALGLGAVLGADENDYVPAYARTSRGQADSDDEQDAASTAVPDDSEESNLTDVIEDVDQTSPRNVSISSETTAENSSGTARATASQPFWALAPTERDVFDERGAPLFRIGPTAWALVVEDRGGAYVVRHDDGRIGYLHDIADITKG